MTSLRRKERSASAKPAAAHAARYAACPSDGQNAAPPSVSDRINTTPCHVGVTYASSRKPCGSRDTGKNVPEKRNIGVTPNRKSALKPSSRSSHAAIATTGSEKVGDVNATIVTASRDGASTKWYVDPATGRLLRTVRNTPRGEVIADYADWKPFGGLNFPTSLTLTMNGEKQGAATVKNVEVNPTVDPKIFQKPETK